MNKALQVYQIYHTFDDQIGVINESVNETIDQKRSEYSTVSIK